MTVTISSTLDCSPDTVWRGLQRPALLLHLSHPLLRMRLVQPDRWPERWERGQYLVRLRLLGFIPAGEQVIRIEDPEVDPPPGHYGIRDRGWGSVAHTWDHEIRVAPLGDGKTRYTDRVVVEAGVLTPLAVAFAHMIYRHRQRRLRHLARNGFTGVLPAEPATPLAGAHDG